ncbi:MFS transporter [Solimonas sp. K1W22B-7]|uniref:MFS transporter n=1 Tax=Solimonas sp. K1W22B-7 TaxID=2303331 RepID=UPI001F08F1D2|nr:MFS transporter [Solimonas sp. K1W22B-7]
MLLNSLSIANRCLMHAFSIDIIADLRLSLVQFSLLTGFAFTFFFALSGLAMGTLADRLNRPRLIAAGALVSSVIMAATGAVTNFSQMLAARTLSGIGESALSPAALGLLGDLFSRNRRALAIALFNLGLPIGVSAAYIAAGTYGATMGWRSCFSAIGVFGVLLALPILLFSDQRSKRHALSTDSKKSTANLLRETWRVLVGSPALSLAILGGVLALFAGGTLVLGQLWLVQERGFDKSHAQNIVGAMFLAGGIAGSLIGGMGGDYMQAKRRGGHLYFLAIVFAICAPFGFIYRFMDPSGVMFYVCMFIECMLLTVGYAPLFAFIQSVTPSHVRSTMIAFALLCTSLLGNSLGNLFVGYLAEAFISANVREPITSATLIGTIPFVLTIPCFYLAARAAQHGQTAPSAFSGADRSI